jgi:hypothetical protein
MTCGMMTDDKGKNCYQQEIEKLITLYDQCRSFGGKCVENWWDSRKSNLKYSY